MKLMECVYWEIKTMNKAYKFEKQQHGGRWFLVCTSHEHFPMIEYCKDKTYKVRGSNGKVRIEREFNSAMKFAIEEHKKMTKFNKNWDKQNA